MIGKSWAGRQRWRSVVAYPALCQRRTGLTTEGTASVLTKTTYAEKTLMGSTTRLRRRMNEGREKGALFVVICVIGAALLMPVGHVAGRDHSLSPPALPNSPASSSSRETHLRDFSPLPEEPGEFDDREVKAYYDRRNDLFFREFDLNGDGTVNYMTARRTYKVWLDEFGTPVVVTVGSPLFYWLDRNGNGEFETGQGEMWSDPDEDGITGNERIYDTSHLERQPSRVPRWSAPVP